MPAIVKEAYAPLMHELTTVVVFAPNAFQVDDFKGSMASWQDFGKFISALTQGRDELPDNVKQTIHPIGRWHSRSKEKNRSVVSVYATKYPVYQYSTGNRWVAAF
jgi:hypothetical protein